MVGKNDDYLPRASKDEANWDMVKDAYPEFAVVRIPMNDPIAIRLAAEQIAGLAQRLLALTHRSAGLDMHATMSKCYDAIRITNAKIRHRPVRAKTRHYVHGVEAPSGEVVNLRNLK